jgi:hypothetical protein
MKRLTGILAVVALAGACAGDGGDAQTAADTLTRAQKDSLVAELPIPGARGVGSALEARDRLDARARAHDTIR